jgi:hypothetical protein
MVSERLDLDFSKAYHSWGVYFLLWGSLFLLSAEFSRGLLSGRPGLLVGWRDVRFFVIRSLFLCCDGES